MAAESARFPRFCCRQPFFYIVETISSVFSLMPYALCLSPFAFLLPPYAFRLMPYALCLTTYVLRLPSYALRLLLLHLHHFRQPDFISRGNLHKVNPIFNQDSFIIAAIPVKLIYSGIRTSFKRRSNKFAVHI